MKNIVIYLLALIHGGIWASAWWGAAIFGWGEDFKGLWVIPGVITMGSILFFAFIITRIFNEE